MFDSNDFSPASSDWQHHITANAETTESLRERGLIQAKGLISIELNDRLKAVARQQGKTADVFIGELITRSADLVERFELEQEAARLREKLGDDWFQRLEQFSRENG